MIAASTASRQPPATTIARLSTWQRSLANAITDPTELIAILQLDPALQSAAREAAKSFPLRVPRDFVARMSKGNPRDPLLLQVLPLHAETLPAPNFVADPVGDLNSRAAPNVLHKYQGRALLITTGACAVHCRYCFRRHYPYAQDHLRGDDWQQALAYLHTHTDINEVILSGGDPLSLSDARLAEISDSLARIAHIKRLRIHTRQPIVLPERVDDGFCAWLEAVPLQTVVVVHCNHAQEIDSHVRRACERMRAAGALLLNQSVLLAGINDSVAALADLSESLMQCRVLPYYIHLLDRVLGAAHFDVPEQRAKQLLQDLGAQLPGFLVPRIVREVAGANSKTPLAELLALGTVAD